MWKWEARAQGYAGSLGGVWEHGWRGPGFPPEQQAEQSHMSQNRADGEEQVLWPARRKHKSGHFRFEMLLRRSKEILNKGLQARNTNSVIIQLRLACAEKVSIWVPKTGPSSNSQALKMVPYSEIGSLYL